MSEHLEESLRTPVAGQYDVIVAGAGPAGVPAAIAAARHGARVLLIEAHGCLGGVWTAGLLAWVFDIECTAIGGEIMERLRTRDACVLAPGEGMVNFTYDVESMKLILEELCVEHGIEVMLHTRVVAARVDEKRRLRSVVTESKSGRQAWSAHSFIDCTGDGDLGALAGNRFAMGSEESGALQPMTFMGLMAVADIEAVAKYVSFYRGDYNHGSTQIRFSACLRDLGVETSYGHPTLFQVRQNLLAIMVNHEYGVDATDTRSVTRATFRGRAEMNRVVDVLAASRTPFSGSMLVSSAEHIGIREGRRLYGRYKVTIDDLMSGTRHEDAVCRVRFNVDVHAPDPSQGRGLETRKVVPYDIPLRALIAQDVDGLLMAGRCISGDWLSFASYRVTGAAVSMGEAAGGAAALAAKQNILPHQLTRKFD